MSDKNDPKNKITNGEHLTWVDMFRAQSEPTVATDEVTGRTVYPREEYLTRRAQERKDEAERAARAKNRK